MNFKNKPKKGSWLWGNFCCLWGNV